MEIDNVGHTFLCSPNLHLKNILHVPQAHKSLCSVNRLTRDNNVFLEFHPNQFSIKEQVTNKVLHRGRCEGGLYPLRTMSTSNNKQACSVIKPSNTLWHHRLGHPSSQAVQPILSLHKLPFASDENNSRVCDACQQGKSHQLPYPRSSSQSSHPLELVFLDVWGPTPVLVGRYSYYVSFIDDYSKFVWFYLLRDKSKDFQYFKDFQNLVER